MRIYSSEMNIIRALQIREIKWTFKVEASQMNPGGMVRGDMQNLVYMSRLNV